MRYIGWLAGLMAIAGTVWWATLSQTDETGNDPLSRTAVVERGDLVVSISATGVVKPVERIDVKSKASGEIIELPVEEGDLVTRGTLIARLDPTTAQNDYDQSSADFLVAEVALKQQKTELARQQDLFDRGLTSESVLDNARLGHQQATAQVVRARAMLSTARERLDDTEIRSPIDGIVLTRPVESGQIISSGTTTVTGGTLICTIANMNEVFVVTDVDETDIGQIRVGMIADVQPDAYPQNHLVGKVLRIAPQAKVQQNVTMFEVICVVSNHDGLLRAGMNATVEVVMDRAVDVLLIPMRAVEMKSREAGEGGGRSEGETTQTDSGGGSHGGRPGKGSGHKNGMFPWVQVQSNGETAWKKIRMGLTDMDQVVVREGVNEGDTLIYSLNSGVMRSREEFRERMRNRSSGNLRRGK